MGGYAQQRERASNLEAVIKGVIQKPFMLEQIQSHVEDALQRPSQVLAERA